MREKPVVYLDHAAATPLDPRVKEAMLPYLEGEYGNPSALYSLGRASKEAVDNARDIVARILGCTAAEVIFTGSGTESDNLAIFGVAKGYAKMSVIPAKAGIHGSPIGVGDDIKNRGHLITTNFEHHAVLNPCKALEKEGYAVTYLRVDRDGLITPEQLLAALRPDTILVSIMYANNEIGTIEPIVELARVMREWKKTHDPASDTDANSIRHGGTQHAAGRREENAYPFFHTDACQAAGYLDINVKKLGVDLLTINGSKIYGPKGTGALYVRRGLRLKPLIYGGGQEFGLRSGTENVAGIVGLATALNIVSRLRNREIDRITPLRDKLIAGILAQIPGAELNGHATKRLPNNINISIPGIAAEAMLFYLDEAGIAAASGSACESVGPDPSHVVPALGKSRERAKSSLRFTLGRGTAQVDIDYVLEKLPEIVGKLRKIARL